MNWKIKDEMYVYGRITGNDEIIRANKNNKKIND